LGTRVQLAPFVAGVILFLLISLAHLPSALSLPSSALPPSHTACCTSLIALLPEPFLHPCHEHPLTSTNSSLRVVPVWALSHPEHSTHPTPLWLAELCSGSRLHSPLTVPNLDFRSQRALCKNAPVGPASSPPANHPSSPPTRCPLLEQSGSCHSLYTRCQRSVKESPTDGLELLPHGG